MPIHTSSLPSADSGTGRLCRRGTGRLSRLTRSSALGVAAALTVSLVVAVEPAAGADAVAAARPKEPKVALRGDLVSARVTARAQGSSVEVESLRDEVSTTWVNPDGTLTTQQHLGPIRYRSTTHRDGSGPAGAWRDVDLELVERPDGTVGPKGHPSGLSLAGGGKGADGSAASSSGTDLAAAHEKPGKSNQARDVVLGWGGSVGSPILSGTKATYKDVKPGVDLTVQALRTGLESLLVINTPEALATMGSGAAEWRIPVRTRGLTARSEKDGSVSFVDADGQVASHLAAPWAWDAATDARSGNHVNESPVAMRVTQQGKGRALVTLTPDKAWLTDPARVYPITIDPTYASGGNVSASFDTYVSSAYSTATYSTATELRVGTYDGGGDKYRSFLTFPLASFKGKDIKSASLSLYEFHSYSCTAKPFYVYNAYAASTSTNWSNQPAAIAQQGSLTTAKGYSSSCAAGRVSVGITALIDAWSGSASTAGALRLHASETDSYGWKKFYSVESSQDPYITFTYNRKPNLAAQPSVSGANTYTAPGSSTPMLFTNKARPTLTTVVTDPDGNGVFSNIQVHSNTTGSALVTYCLTSRAPYTASGATASCTVGTDLADNTTYYLRASSGDDQGLSNGGWSSWRTLYVSRTAPPAPTITCPGYSNGAWTDTPPASDVTCTISAPGVSGTYVAPGYVDLTVDGVKQARVTITPSNDATVAKTTWKFLRTSNGPHTITAVAVSRSLLSSPPKSFGMGWGGASLTLPKTGVATSGKVVIDAGGPPRAGSATVTGKVQWRIAGSGSETTGWTDGPSVTPTSTSSTALVTARTNWDVRTAMREAGAAADTPLRVPVLLDVQFCFTYSGVSTPQCTWSQSPISVTRVPHAFGDGYPVAEAGPGQVALFTGEFNTSATDASVPGYSGSLSISRSHASFDGDGTTAGWPSDPVTGVFGPGWTAALNGPDAGAASLQVVDNTRQDGSIVLVDEEGNPLVFQNPDRTRSYKPGKPYLAATTDTAQTASELTVTGTGTGTSFVATSLALREEDGTVTTWAPVTYTASTSPYTPAADVDWKPVSVNEPGQVGSTTYGHDGAGRVTRIVAAVPPAADGTTAAVSCPTSGTLPKGCRAMDIAYTAMTVGSATVSRLTSVSATLWDPDAAGGTGAMTTTAVATYSYDTLGRLTKVLDPRTNLATDYTWDGTSTRLASVGQTGLAAQRLTYDTTTTPATPRVTTLSRDDASGGPSTVVLARYAYGVPLSGAGLPDLSAGAVAAWGQGVDEHGKAPATGYAVFGQDYTGAVTGSGVDWSYADLQYADELGYTVNTASFGAGAWQVTATDYDTAGNVIRELDAGAINAVKAAAAANAALDRPEIDALSTQTVYNDDIVGSVDEDGTGPAVAVTRVVTPAGTFVTDTYGPARDASLTTDGDGDGVDDVLPVRPHTHTDYDQNAPTSAYGPGVNPATRQPWRLPTTITTGVADAAAAIGAADIETISTTVNGYAKLSPADATEGDPWALGTPTTVTAGGITTTTRYDTEGRVTQTRQPLSTGADAGTSKQIYYTAQTNTADSACGNKVEWAGLTCRSLRAGTPTAGAAGASTLPDSRTTKYSKWLLPVQVVETSGTATRTTENRYDSAGRSTATWTTTSAGVTGATARPGTFTHYRTDNGLIDYTGKLNPTQDGADTAARTTTTYDAWGRALTMTNDLGDTTTSTYVTAGQPGAGQLATVTQTPADTTSGPAQTTAYTYDGTDADAKTERRGRITGLTVTRAGAGNGILRYAAAYDADEALVTQKLPGAVTQRIGYDAAGEATSLTYTGQVTPVTESLDADGNTVYTPGAPQQDQPWLAWTVINDAAGRIRAEATGPSAGFDGAPGVTDITDATAPAVGEAVSYDRLYRYDAAGRLTTVTDRTATAYGQDLGAAPCTTRAYQFDGNGRRGTLTTTTHEDGDCAGTTGTTVTASTWAYDSADRPTTAASGAGQYTYDVLGRQTGVPAADAPDPSAGDITLGYYDDDLPRTVAQNGTTTTFTLDSAGRRLQAATTTGTLTTQLVRHYSDAADNPSWTVAIDATGQKTVTRYVESISGELGGRLAADGSAALTLANLHGDVVTTVPIPAGQAGTSPATGTDGWSDYTEYGQPHEGSPEAAQAAGTVTGGAGYGWLGAHQRATTAETAGLTLMGDRLYNAATGRFTSLDPEPGGSPTPYAYPTDPVNQFDLDGHWWGEKKFKAAKAFYERHKTAIEVGLFVASLAFGGGAIGGAVLAYRAYRVVRIARAARAVGFRSFSMRVSRPVAHIAGRMWTRGGVRLPNAENGARHLRAGNFHYRGRSASTKGKYGRSSNLEYMQRGHHQHFNFHMTARRINGW